MQQEFKVGDRVVFTEHYLTARKGDMGTVMGDDGSAPLIYTIALDKGRTVRGFAHRLKLIEEPKGIQRQIAVYDPNAATQPKPVLLKLEVQRGTQRPTLFAVDEHGHILGSILSFNNDGSILLYGGLSKTIGIPVDGAGRAVISNLPSI